MNSLENLREYFRSTRDPVEFLQSLFVCSPTATQVLDSNGTLIFENPAFAKLFGAPSKPGYRVFEDRAIEDPNAHRLIRAAFEGQGQTLPVRWHDVPGPEPRRIAVEGRIFPTIAPSGRLLFAIMHYTDVTSDMVEQEQMSVNNWFLEKAQELGQMGSWISEFAVGGKLQWSKQVHRIFGVSEKEFDGRVDTFFKLVHPDDRALVAAASEAAQRGEKPYAVTHKIRRPDGTIRWVHQRAEVARDFNGVPYKMVGIVQDVTEILNLEVRFRKLFDAEVLGFFTADVETGLVVESNERFLKMIGYDRDDLRERRVSWRDMTPPEYLEVDERGTTAVLKNGELPAFEKEYIRKDGTRLPVLVGATSHTPGDPCVLCFAFDLTERKGFEDRIRQSQKLEAIGRLAGGVAHDFNNLLSIILLHLDRAELAGATSGPAGKSLKIIHSAAEKATRLTRQLLAFSRRQVLQIEAVNVNVVISEMEQFLAHVFTEPKCLRVKLDPRVGFIRADRGQIEQVIMNLVVNAKDAMTGSGEVCIETQECKLIEPLQFDSGTELAPGRYALLRIRDTGCGMAPETLKKAFEPFFTTKEKGTGTGLGLATVFGIVKQSGGEIVLESAVGVGTVAHIYFPATETEDQISEVAAVPPKPRGAGRILFVEDEDDLREVTEDILTKNGYEVVMARNGREALELAHRCEGDFDLVLTDVLMPDLSGPALIRRLRSELPTRTWNHFYLSGYPAEELAQHDISPSDSKLLTKPYTAAALLTRVSEALNRKPNN